MQLQLHYITQRYTTLINIHYTTATTTTATTTTTTTTLHCTTLHNATLELQLQYFTLHYSRLHYRTQHYSTQYYSTLHYRTLMTPHHTTTTCNYTNYTNYTTLQLQLHYTTATTTASLQHTTSSSCGWGDHCNRCNHSKKHNSNHLSVHQWIRSAIHASQQLTSPTGSYLWNFHRLVRYYW